MGSLIIKEVVNELLMKGLDNAKVLLLAGSRSGVCVCVCYLLYIGLCEFYGNCSFALCNSTLLPVLEAQVYW